MKTIVGILVVVLVGVVILGFYQDWFHLSTNSDQNNTNVHLTVDKEKFKEDEEKAKEKLHDMETKLKSKIENHGRQAEPTVSSDTGVEEKSREDYKNKVTGQIQDYDQRIEELKTKAAKVKGEAKEALEQDIDKLSKKKDEAHKKLEELRSANSEKWEQIKTKMDDTLQELKTAYEKAVSHSS